VEYILGPVIQIWKDVGPMCFWSHVQASSGKVYYTKVAARLPNSKVVQVLTPTRIPLTYPRATL